MLSKLKNIKEHINQAGNAVNFDYAKFNDPMAKQVKWTALKQGGSNGKTHTLHEINSDRLEYKMAATKKVGSLFFLILFTALPLYFIIMEVDFTSNEAFLFIALFGAMTVFLVISTFKKIRHESIPIVLDKSIGKFWKAKEGPDVKPELMNSPLAYDLDHVHAIQLLAHYVKRERTGFYAYELNFVMNDTQRLNVIRHGRKGAILEDGERISKFLNVPVWDAS
jgi:hypothetical protein